MKVITYIFLYITLTMVYFFTLSLIGLLWFNWGEIISNPNWFTIYILLFSWWLPAISLNEYYDKYLKPLWKTN